jgi:phage-related tail protein
LTPEQQAQADFQAYEAQIRKVISDPARADQLVALTNEYQQQMRESAAIVRDYRSKLTALNANYDATREDFKALFSQQDAHREAFLRKVAALREQMAALTTDAEWEELDKARQRTLDVDLQNLVS